VPKVPTYFYQKALHPSFSLLLIATQTVVAVAPAQKYAEKMEMILAAKCVSN
jgi:hypothetical protein